MGRPKKPESERAFKAGLSLPQEMATELQAIAVERYARGQRDGVSGAIREILRPALAARRKKAKAAA